MIELAATGGDWTATSFAAAIDSTSRVCGKYAGRLVRNGYLSSVQRHVELPVGRRQVTFYSWTGLGADDESPKDRQGHIVTDTHWGCLDPEIDHAVREMIKAGRAAMQTSYPIVPRSALQ